ncbi:hypothetical protein GOBAR_AA16405 [Gossypium barbadense]|uniref:Pre-rRNA-processing protein RIX1 N-terminal domain-containing protein n=1 Tax=Gossypium barbadense TaxID=3634 RepID=A0A2P5XLQ5_GOSBA|nr:hypothetical protein GOBAR_AA16405 [Gossypium barbadense]
MQKHLHSVALAFLLIGYKFIRQVSTELSLSKVTDIVKCVNSLLKKLIDDAPNLGDDAIVHLRNILCTSLDELADLTKDCIEGIHLIYFSVFKFCTNCMLTILTDSNLQVYLPVLCTKQCMTDNQTLLGHRYRLSKSMTKELVVIVGECLQVLMLLQTVSKESDCQRGFMSLFLEAIVMIFSASEDNFSQEVNDIRNTAIRLVSHLAQIPSSAGHLKDVLLLMSETHRHQLQGDIRASVTLDHSVGETKSLALPLEIKLPVPLEMRTEDNALPSATQVKLKQQSNNNDDMEENEEDEDDWDAFQSFPATKNVAETGSVVESTVKEPDHDESISSALEISTDNSQQYSSSENHNSINNVNAEHSEVAIEILTDCSGDGGNREKILSDLVVEEVKELSAKIEEHA